MLTAHWELKSRVALTVLKLASPWILLPPSIPLGNAGELDHDELTDFLGVLRKAGELWKTRGR